MHKIEDSDLKGLVFKEWIAHPLRTTSAKTHFP